MAEHSFQEVMRQWVRARKATKWSGEENNVLSVYPLEAYDDTLIANIEENVMAWAAEHPEPAYPTWIDWLRDIGVIPTQEEASRSMRDGVRAASFYVTAKAFSQIPADIAQKLGIQPKEG